MMPATSPSAEDLRRVVDCALRVPSTYREFRHNRLEAKRIHGLSGEALTALLDLGLPHRRSGGEVLLNPRDLSNASFQLRLPSARAMAMRGWAIGLRDVEADAPPDRAVTVAPMCPDRGHDGECRFEADFAGPPRPIPPLDERDPGPNTLRATASKSSRLLPRGLHDLAREVGRLELYLLPYELAEDLGFARETGLADCPLATNLLIEEARAAGFTMRASAGFLLARPYATVHMWAEVFDEGEWLPMDPLIISTLAGRGLLDSTRWPPFRSLAGAVLRLRSEPPPMMLHNGEPCDYSIKTNVW